jgi:hypothetical protein
VYDHCESLFREIKSVVIYTFFFWKDLDLGPSSGYLIYMPLLTHRLGSCWKRLIAREF